jgi:N-formylglutamate deformylase
VGDFRIELEGEPWRLRPAQKPIRPIVASIPHAGVSVPRAIATRFASSTIAGLPMTDWYLDELYDFLPELGIVTLIATQSRFVADCNRPPAGEVLYPGRFETGLVPTQTFDGDPVWTERPDAAWIEEVRLRVWQPYHDRLAALLDQWQQRFGSVVLLDLHSVSSLPNRIAPQLAEEIFLGDREGRSAGHLLRETIHQAYVQAGFTVSVNHPYKGGYITDHYGRPPAVQALQIEMAERVYLDEQKPGSRDPVLWLTACERIRSVWEDFVPAFD